MTLTGPPTVDQFAQAWSRAIARTSHTSMSRRALRAHLRGLGSARCWTPSPRRGSIRRAPHEVGAALVAAHFTEVTALQRTVTVLGEQLGNSPGRQRAADGRGGRLDCWLRAGVAGPHPGRTGTNQRVGVCRPGRRRAGAVEQRGPVRGGVRRVGDRYRRRRHRRQDPGSEPFPLRNARVQR